MSYEYASDAIDVVSIAMVVIAIGIIWSRSIGLGLILLSVQSVLLALGGLHAGIATEEWHVVLGAALTFTAKAVVAPLLLWRIVSRPEVSHDVHASVGQGWSTIAAVITALTAFYGMPMVIELGIFLDLLLAVFVAFVYSQRMHLAFGSLDTLHFRSLRG